MDIVISNKYVDNNKIQDQIKNTTNGQFFSQERYYTWINNQIDYRLKSDHKILYILISFICRSSNFRHNSSFYKKPFWVTLIDIICWLCVISFFICLFTGVAGPIITAIKQLIKLETTDFMQALIDAFNQDPWKIVAFVFSLITLGIGTTYLYVLKKVISKNKSLAIKDYVLKKIDYIVRFSPWVKTEQKLLKKIEKISKKSKNILTNYIIFENVEILNDADRWNVIQALNILNKLFYDFKIVLYFKNIDETYKDVLQNIIDIDFRNSKIIEITSN